MLLSIVKDIILVDRSDYDIDIELFELFIKIFDFDSKMNNVFCDLLIGEM